MKRYKLVIPDKISKNDCDSCGKVMFFDGQKVSAVENHEGLAYISIETGTGHKYTVSEEWLQEIKEPMTFDDWVKNYRSETSQYGVPFDMTLEYCWEAAIKSERMTIGKQPEFSIFCMTEGIDHKDVEYTKVEMTTDGHCSESINARTGKKYKLVEVK